MERGKEVAIQRILKGNAICDHMIEQAIHIVAVRSARGRGHSQHETRREMVEDLAIAKGTRPVSLIDDDVIERIGGILVKPSSERFHHREHAGRIPGTLIPGKKPIPVRIPENTFVAMQRCRKYALPMGDEQDLPGTLPLNVKRGKVRLARSGGGHEQSPRLFAAMQHRKRLQGALLHFVRDDSRAGSGSSAIGRKRHSLVRIIPESPRRASLLWPGVLLKIAPIIRDPTLGQRNGFLIVPQLLVLLLCLQIQPAVGKRPEQDVPFLVARQSRLRQVRASDDDRRDLIFVEEVAFRMKITLVHTRFDVRVFQQFAQSVRIVEVQIG